MEAIAREKRVTTLDVALAWLRQQHEQTSMATITILGPRTEQQLMDNLNSLKTTLTPDELLCLNDVSIIPLGFPHDIIASTRESIFGAGTALMQTKYQTS